jgi:hypothetical protein
VKDVIAQAVADSPAGVDPRNLVREYLQARILESLQRAGAMVPLAFMGGTALRFLYRTPRYSEDLDFSIERNHDLYDLRAWLERIRVDFIAEAYNVEIAIRETGAVHSARIGFPGLLAELGLSPHASEKLTVTLQIDTDPPAGAGIEITLVRRYVAVRLQHHDRASLLAGKLNALLTREWVKGRDVFDLVWYLADPEWPAPNLVMLDNALAQFGRPALGADSWRDVVRQRLAGADQRAIENDVAPFLEHPDDIRLVSTESVERVLTMAR